MNAASCTTPLLEKFTASWQSEYRAMQLGLERIASLLTALNHPEKSYPTVLVAGTNGKGSTASLLATVLQQAGYKTGLYTSPHLEDFCERIQISGQNIAASQLESILLTLQEQGYLDEQGNLRNPSEHSPAGEVLTWFEKVTALAFLTFQQEEVDIAILEVGLGGRFDATNVADPLLSIITSIGLDHCALLGNSVFDIAREKAGIMRAQRPVILAHMDEAVRHFLSAAAGIVKAQAIRTAPVKGSNASFFYRHWDKLKLKMSGRHQLNNAAAVLEAVPCLREAGFKISDEAVHEAFAQWTLPGRLELIEARPALLLDGAHNPQALQNLHSFLESQGKTYPPAKICFVMAMMRDKDPRATLKLLQNSAQHWIFTELQTERALTLEEWQKLCAFDDISINAHYSPSPEQALHKAQSLIPEDGLIVIAGSLYLVGEIRKHLSTP